MSTELDLAPIKARAEAATEGPWIAEGGSVEADVCSCQPLTATDPAERLLQAIFTRVGGYHAARVQGCPEWGRSVAYSDGASPACLEDDAEFIAHARWDVPALIAEVERLRRGGRTLGQIIDKAHQDVLDATQMHHVINEDGDGDWALVWERLHELCRIGRNYQEAVRGL